MFVLIYEEGNCGCDLDPYKYRILGIFNTKDAAEICVKEKEIKIENIKKRETLRSIQLDEYWSKKREDEEFDPNEKFLAVILKEYENEEYFMYYKIFIDEVETPLTTVKDNTLFLVIRSEQEGGNFRAVEEVFKTKQGAELFITEFKEKYRGNLYIFPFTNF